MSQGETLLLHHGKVGGVLAVDRQSGQRLEFRAPVVINAAGPWCRQVAQKFDRDYPRLLRNRLLLFNILFKRKALSEYALALVPPGRPDHTYFVHNWKGRMLAGTAEIAVAAEDKNPVPQPRDITDFIADMNDAVPELLLGEKDIETHLFRYPAGHGDRQALRPRGDPGPRRPGRPGRFVQRLRGQIHHLAPGGRKNHEKNIPRVQAKKTSPPAAANSGRGFFAYDWQEASDDDIAGLKPLIEEEAVVHLDDLVFRRTGLGENRRRIAELLPRLRSLFPWNDGRWQQECERLLEQIQPR